MDVAEQVGSAREIVDRQREKQFLAFLARRRFIANRRVVAFGTANRRIKMLGFEVSPVTE